MENRLKLPRNLADLLDGYMFVKNTVGESVSVVYRCTRNDETFFLKITPDEDWAKREIKMLRWLNGKLPVPELRYSSEENGFIYLLMTEASGSMVCDLLEYDPGLAVGILADGLLMLQHVNIGDCPVDNSLDVKLRAALYNIENGFIDTSDWESKNSGKTPVEVYRWLTENRPETSDLCFTHGDYCLPNIFTENGKISAFIDLGDCGIVDKWQDIALCMRSLGHNLGVNGIADTDKYVALLFERLGIAPDWDMIDYYITLDELF